MTTDEYKSIAVDYDTWETLARWSENECRTVGGQIRFLVKTHSPLQKREVQTSHNIEEVTIGSVIHQEDNWTRKRRTHSKRVYLKDTQGYSIMDLLLEYKEPMTNKEIYALAPENWGLIGIDTLDSVQKMTASLYSQGLLKRRPSLIIKENLDRFQYQLTPSGERLLKTRDKKRKKAGWIASDLSR